MVALEAAVRDEYYPVGYVHPIEGNEGAVLVDLASYAAGNATLQQALESWENR